MKYKRLIGLLLSLAPSFCFSHNITLAHPLPNVTVVNQGELLLKNNTIHYQTWHSKALTGKMRIVVAMAGRSKAKALNAPLIDAITKQQFSENSYQTTTIINQNDALWGTGSFVESATEESKRTFPWSSIVLDKKGIVQKAWGLEKESSAVFVLDHKGNVLYVKDGQLTTKEINTVINLIKHQLE